MPRRNPTKRGRRRKTSSKQKQVIKSVVNRTLNSRNEWKHIRYFNSLSVTGGTGQTNQLSHIPQGDQVAQRDGNTVRATRLHLKYALENADYSNTVRVIVYQWIPNTTPSAGVLLADTTSVYCNLAPYNTDHVGKDKSALILYDKFHTLNENYSGGIERKQVNTKIDLRRKKIEMLEATGVQGNNHIWVTVVSDSALSSHPTFTYMSRLYFQDS